MLHVYIVLPDKRHMEMDINPLPTTPADESKFLDALRLTFSKANNLEIPGKNGVKLILWGDVLKNSYIITGNQPPTTE